MERSKILLWVLVLAAAAVIVWRVGFSVPESYLSTVEQKAGGAEPGPAPNEPPTPDANQVRDANAPADANEPGDPNQPAGGDDPNGTGAPAKPSDAAPKPDANEPDTSTKDVRAKPAEPNTPEDPNNPMEAVNLKEVEMKQIIDKIATWTGKTVIPNDEAMKQKITIYAPNKLPRTKALHMIYSALRMKGYVAEEVDETIFLKPIADAKLGVLPTVRADQPLAMFENKDQIVQKFFKLSNYPPSQMSEVIRPLVGEYGHVSADETTGTVLVIESVANLLRIERIIAQFDIPEAGQAVTEIFEIEYGDPSEIVQLLRMLLGEAPGGSTRNRNSNRSRVRGRPPSRGSSQGSSVTPIVTGTSDIPLVLIPEPKRKWIIARGSADDLQQIDDWIEKLDLEETIGAEYETVAIAYADASEVASRIEDALAEMPGTELIPSILVRPLAQSRQIMIFGREDLRNMVKKLIAEIDMPAGTYETKVFDLEHADPEQIKTNIDSLYGDQGPPMYDSYYYYRYGPGSRSGGSDTVKVIAFPTMGQVTVICSPENMRKIEKQIAEWDVPLDVDAVKPRIIELQNSDPVQMVDLLTKLFSEDQDDSSSLLRYIFYGRGGGDQRKKIVGPLYGQLTFEDVPGTKKIIVISKIPQAYDVVEQLILDLDRQEMAEIPNVVQLQYADPEDLAERLNAMFNEPGTTARIRRKVTGLSDYTMGASNSGQGGGANNNNNNSNRNDTGTGEEYTPWWSAGGVRRNVDEEPISNVIGRVRFVPDPRSKSLLVLAPPEFQASIEETIMKLDTPSKQVLIKAIIIGIDHSNMTSLGVQLATNPDAFGNLEENAITALGQLTSLSTQGSAVATGPQNSPLGAEGSGTIVGGTTAIYGLVDFLVKQTNAKVLNQQSLWTEDNEEASFFKGDNVAFQTNISTSDTGGRVTSGFEFNQVGMTLRVRPSITPEHKVDMIINVILSQLTGEIVNGQPVRGEMQTTTNMIVLDGETIMLGGMLFQKDTLINRKLPLLGDLPLVGGLFQHNDAVQSNSELIVFITPFVIDDGQAVSEKATEQIEDTRQKLRDLQSQLDETSRKLDEKLEKK